MVNKYQCLVMASLIFGLGVGLSGIQAAAEEVGAENIAAAAAVPTMSPVAAPVSTTFEPTRSMEKQSGKFKQKRKELELNWNVAIGMASYSENNETYGLSSKGAMLEINPGINVTTAPGLDIGTVVGFLFISGDTSFDAVYTGPPAYTRRWEVSAMSVGSYILAKYSYDIDLDVIKIGLENGLGLGFFINSVSADWKDASDSNIRGDNSGDEHYWAPVVKAGLKIAVPVTDVSSLGLNIGANLIPLFAVDYSNFITVSAGLNYQVKY